MTDLLLVLLINFFALYTTSQYLAVLKKEEQKKTWRCLLPHFLLWCVLNTCCLILIRTKGVLSLFSAAVAAIILLFETIFAFQKEEAWKEKTRRKGIYDRAVSFSTMQSSMRLFLIFRKQCERSAMSEKTAIWSF